jgi:hypothetical protein
VSDKTARLSALKQAQWRVKHAGQRCRLCGGSTIGEGRYCQRHWKCLRGGGRYNAELMAAAARGERLDEADAVIRLRDTFARNLKLGSGGRILVHEWQIFPACIADGSYGWRIADRNLSTLAEMSTVDDVMAWIRHKSETYQLRNRYAVKRLIL